MKPSTKRPPEGNGSGDALARAALAMIAAGETSRTIEAYHVSLTLLVEPRFRGKKNGGGQE